MPELQKNNLEVFSNCLKQTVYVSFIQMNLIHIYEVFLLNEGGAEISGFNIIESLNHDVIYDLQNQIRKLQSIKK